jgi:hypothetical protein
MQHAIPKMARFLISIFNCFCHFLPNPSLNKECLRIISYNICPSPTDDANAINEEHTHLNPTASKDSSLPSNFCSIMTYHDISWHIMTYHDIHDLQLVGKGSPTCSNSLPRFDLDGRSCGLSYSSDRFALLPDQASLPQL